MVHKRHVVPKFVTVVFLLVLTACSSAKPPLTRCVDGLAAFENEGSDRSIQREDATRICTCIQATLSRTDFEQIIPLNSLQAELQEDVDLRNRYVGPNRLEQEDPRVAAYILSIKGDRSLQETLLHIADVADTVSSDCGLW